MVSVIRHHLSRGYCLRLNCSGDTKTRNNPKPGNLGCKAKALSLGGKQPRVGSHREGGAGCKHTGKFRR